METLEERMAEVNAYEDATGLPQDHAIELKNAEMVLASDVELIEPTPVENTDHSTVFEQKSSSFFVSRRGSPRQDHTQHEALNKYAVEKRGLAVVVPPVERPWEYLVYKEPSVSTILGEYDDGGRLRYLVQLDDEREDVVSGSLLQAHYETWQHPRCLDRGVAGLVLAV